MAAPQASIFAPSNKRTIRSEPNEFDKATIVSIYPREVVETKHTIVPGKFIIPAGSVAKPTIVVVGPSSWFRDLGEDQPNIEIPNNAVQIADSIVKDWSNGMLMVDKDAMPGIFFIPGNWTLAEIKDKYKGAFESAVKKQNFWFKRLVDLADVGWARTNGNPQAIDDLMRMAANELGQTANKDWMRSTILSEMVKCVACGNLRNPSFPICGACNRVIDAELAKKLGIDK